MTLISEAARRLDLINAIIALLAFAANLLQIVIVYRGKRKLDQFYITLNALAIMNMIVAALDCAYSFSLYFAGRVDFLSLDAEWKVYAWYLYIFAVLSSTFHVVFIAIQRFLAVYKPMKFRQNFTRKICCIILVVQYFPNMLIAVAAYFIDKKSEIGIGAIAVSLLLLLFGFMLGPTYLLIWRKTAKRPTHLSNNVENQSHLVLQHAIVVSTFFILTLFPFCIHELLFYLRPKLSIPQLATKIIYILITLKFLLDPVIYFFVSIMKNNKCISIKRVRIVEGETQDGAVSTKTLTTI